jgi:2-methylcitrate synthase
MDVMRTGVSVLGTLEPEKEDHGKEGAQRIANRLMASLGSMLLYWYHYSHKGKRIDTETDDDSVGGHFLHLLHQKEPGIEAIRAMHTSLLLYAEHEFNASTFACRVVAGTSTAAPTNSPSKSCRGTRTWMRRKPTSCAASGRRRS